jgi:hypothetical protein
VASVPRQILTAAATRLQTVTTANGYTNTLRRVSRKWEDLESQNELPIAFVIRAEVSPEHIYDELAGAGTLGLGETGELIKAFLDFEVYLYTQGSDAEEPSDTWEDLAADVERALTLDLHLGLSPDVVWDVKKIQNVANRPVVSATWYRIEGADLYRASYQYERGAP